MLSIVLILTTRSVRYANSQKSSTHGVLFSPPILSGKDGRYKRSTFHAYNTCMHERARFAFGPLLSSFTPNALCTSEEL